MREHDDHPPRERNPWADCAHSDTGDHCSDYYAGYGCCYCGAEADDETVEANRP